MRSEFVLRGLPVAFLLAAVGLANPAEAATCTVRYYGGPVISNVRVVQVNWGSGIDATVDAGLAGYYRAVLDSPYLDWLVEYDTVGKTGYADGAAGSNQAISRGSFGGRYVITPAASGISVTDDQVAAELAAQIAAGHLPAPEYDAAGRANSLYLIEFPSGISITGPSGLGASCVTFCAYHGSVNIGGKEIPYGVLPDVNNGGCAGGCGTGMPLDNATMIHSQQILQAVTDTQIGVLIRTGATAIGRPAAWYADQVSCGEIGDMCNGQTAVVAGYTVQKGWSQSSMQCIAQAASPVPICTGTAGATCRRCVVADEGRTGGCLGATPHCDLDPASPQLGQCVAAPAPVKHSGGCSSAGLETTSPLALLLAFLALRRRRPAA